MLGTCPNAGSVCQEKGFVDGGWAMRENWCGTHHNSEVVGQEKGLGKVHE